MIKIIPVRAIREIYRLRLDYSNLYKVEVINNELILTNYLQMIMWNWGTYGWVRSYEQ